MVAHGGDCLKVADWIQSRTIAFIDKHPKIQNVLSKFSPSVGSSDFMRWLGVDAKKNALSEATYFACLKKLSETMGKMPLHLYQNTDKGVVGQHNDELIKLLKARPNPYMTPSTFWSTVEMNRNHHGNAFVFLRWNKFRLDSMWIMPSEDVSVVVDDGGVFGQADAIWYQYVDRQTGELYIFHSDDVLHFKTSTTFDGLTGASVQETLKSTIQGNLAAQDFITNLYENGVTARAVVQYTGDLSDEKQKRLVKGFEEFSSGTKNAGRMIPVPAGMQIQPLNLKLTDSQFFELKKYSALQVASAFGIKPNQINDYEKSSYRNSESQNLAFYTDTVLYIVKQYEEEITYKLLSTSKLKSGFFFKFNVSVILRTDAETQMKILTGYVQNGVKTPNEARALQDMPAHPDGDNLMANGNYIPLGDIGKQYRKDGDDN